MEEAEANYLKSNNKMYRSLLMKAYYESHKESHKKKCREQAKQRYKNDKEHRLAKIEYNRKKAMERQSDRMMCEVCNCDVARSYFLKHIETQKHLKNLEKKQKAEAENESSCVGIDEEAE